jgi:hypothetical protein
VQKQGRKEYRPSSKCTTERAHQPGFLEVSEVEAGAETNMFAGAVQVEAVGAGFGLKTPFFCANELAAGFGASLGEEAAAATFVGAGAAGAAGAAAAEVAADDDEDEAGDEDEVDADDEDDVDVEEAVVEGGFFATVAGVTPVFC